MAMPIHSHDDLDGEVRRILEGPTGVLPPAFELGLLILWCATMPSRNVDMPIEANRFVLRCEELLNAAIAAALAENAHDRP